MKKTLLLLGLLLSAASILANPISPVIFSEIYFEGDEWYLELYDFYNMYQGDSTLYLRLECNSGVQELSHSISLVNNEIVVITNQDLISPLTFNRNSDYLCIYEGYFEDENIEWYDIETVTWGSSAQGVVGACYSGQSLVNVEIGEYETEHFRLMKNGQPSIGTTPYCSNNLGSIEGYVYDVNGFPIPEATIKSSLNPYLSEFNSYQTTNQEGYYEMNNLYSLNQLVEVYINDLQYGDSLVAIEPDSTVIVNFYTDYVVAEDNFTPVPITKVQAYPNPFYLSDSKECLVRFDFSPAEKNAVYSMAIYDLKGRIIKLINGNNAELTWDGKNNNGDFSASGVYFYSLSKDDKEIAQNKLIIIKQ